MSKKNFHNFCCCFFFPHFPSIVYCYEKLNCGGDLISKIFNVKFWRLKKTEKNEKKRKRKKSCRRNEKDFIFFALINGSILHPEQPASNYYYYTITGVLAHTHTHLYSYLGLWLIYVYCFCFYIYDYFAWQYELMLLKEIKTIFFSLFCESIFKLFGQ